MSDLQYEPRFSEAAEPADEAQTELAVKDPELFGDRDLVRNTRTGEIFLVRSVDSFTVIRGIADTAAPMDQGDELLIVGRAVPEGDLA